ncbi:MAG: class I SAM-dependent methyltransferase [Candidatus Omnitrophota bacterium]
MNQDRCNICSSHSYKKYLDFHDQKKEIVMCNSCKTFRSRPYLLTDYTDQGLYCEHYLKNEDKFKMFSEDIMNLVVKHKKEGRLLDVGCSIGLLLEEAKRLGFKAEGIELNKKASEICLSKGLTVKSGMLKDVLNPGESFDVIILNHVLEHIVELNGFIEDIKDFVAEKGIVVIGVPNHNSLVARLYKARWYGWGNGEHVWHFDRGSFGNLLSNNGFKIKEIIQNSQYYPFSKSFHKNTMATIAQLGNILGLGDQLLAVVKKI